MNDKFEAFQTSLTEIADGLRDAVDRQDYHAAQRLLLKQRTIFEAYHSHGHPSDPQLQQAALESQRLLEWVIQMMRIEAGAGVPEPTASEGMLVRKQTFELGG